MKNKNSTNGKNNHSRGKNRASLARRVTGFREIKKLPPPPSDNKLAKHSGLKNDSKPGGEAKDAGFSFRKLLKDKSLLNDPRTTRIVAAILLFATLLTAIIPSAFGARVEGGGNSNFFTTAALSDQFLEAGKKMLLPSASVTETNFALGQTATQISTGYGGDASRAVDGNTDGNYGNNSVTHTGNSPQAWWQVDLGQSRQIDKIRIWNITGSDSEALTNYYVMTSNTPFTSDDAVTAATQNGVWYSFKSGPATAQTEITVNQSARYVRVQFSAANYLRLAEVEVLGDPNTPLGPTPPPIATNPLGAVTIGCETIDGWAYDQANPSVRLPVNVFMDGRPYKSAVANQFRQDVLNAGHGDGYSGWQSYTTRALRDGTTHSVVAYAGNYQLNPGGNTVLSCTPLTASLNLSATTVPAGGTVNVSWSLSIWRPNTDTVKVFAVGAPDTAPLSSQYVNQSAPGVGTETVTMPTTPGQYEIRYFIGDEPLSYGSSQPITVTGNPTPQPSNPLGQFTFDCDTISGWVYDQANPNTRLPVSISVDGQPYKTATADQFRQDVVTAGHGDGYSGWQVFTSRPLRDGGVHTITVASGSYQLPQANNNVFGCGPINVTLSLSATTAAPGGTVNASFVSNYNRPNTDTMKLFAVGAPNTTPLSSQPVNQTGPGTGTQPFTLPTAAGQYEVRYFVADDPVPFATSQALTVTGNPTPTPTPTITPTPTPGVLTNFALGQTATQKNTNYGGDASRAVDGNTDGNYSNNSVTHSAYPDQPWWQVDLGQSRQIDKIRVWNRTDSNSEALAKYYVITSDTPFTSDDPVAAATQNGAWYSFNPGPATTQTEITVNRSARYVRVQLATSSFLTLAEVEVLGNPNNPAVPNPPGAASPLGAAVFDCDGISGWVYDQANPGTRLPVTVFLDGQPYKTLTANQFRQDVLTAGHGDGYSGWQTFLTRPFRDGTTHTVTIASGSYQLPGPSSVFSCGAVAIWLTPAATSVAAGGTINLGWSSNYPRPPTDTVKVFAVGAPDTATPLSTQNLNPAWGSSGSMAVTMPTTPGQYDIRYFIGDDPVSYATTQPITVTGTTSGNTAVFVRNDTTTQGNWIGAYGGQGYAIPDDGTSLPAWAQVNFSGQSNYTWATTTSDVRALKKAANTGDRLATTWYTGSTTAGSSYTVTYNFTDGQEHQLAFYSLDWDGWNGPRGQTLEVLDGQTSAVLDSRSVNNFGGGIYTIWKVKGQIIVRVTNQVGGTTAVVSGFFIDAPNTPPPTPTATPTATPTMTPTPTITPTPTPTATPTVTPTPQATTKLAKEYIYAGSRMLAIEDYGLTPAPSPTVTPTVTPTPTITPTPTPPTPTPTPGLKPDLVISSFTITPSTPVEGDAVNFSVTVTNQGAGTMSGFLGVRYTVDGQCPSGGCPSHAVSSLNLAPNQSATLTGASATWAATLGGHTLAAQVDDVNSVDESDESNNTSSLNINVGPAPKPDLVLTSFSALPSDRLVAGDAVNFTAVFTNQGPVATPNANIAINYLIDGVSQNITAYSTISVAPNQSVTYSVMNQPWTAAAGNHTITAVLDNLDAVTESNEGNNTATLSLNVNAVPTISPTDYFQIVANHSSKCLEVAGGPTAVNDATALQQWDCIGASATNQLWSFVQVGNTFQMIAKNSGKCADVIGGPTALNDGAGLHQYTCFGASAPNQLWKLIPVNGSYQLVAKHSDKCLDVPASSGNNGAGIQQWTCGSPGQANQTWTLVPVQIPPPTPTPSPTETPCQRQTCPPGMRWSTESCSCEYVAE